MVRAYFHLQEFKGRLRKTYSVVSSQVCQTVAALYYWIFSPSNILISAQNILYTLHAILHTTHYTLHTILHTTHYTLHTIQYRLHTEHYITNTT